MSVKFSLLGVLAWVLMTVPGWADERAAAPSNRMFSAAVQETFLESPCLSQAVVPTFLQSQRNGCLPCRITFYADARVQWWRIV